MVEAIFICITAALYIFSQLILVDFLYDRLKKKHKIIPFLLLPLYLLFTGINLTIILNIFNIYPFLFEEYESLSSIRKITFFSIIAYMIPLLFSAAGFVILIKKKSFFSGISQKKEAFVIVKYLFFLLAITHPLAPLLYGASCVDDLEVNPVEIGIDGLDENFEGFTIVHVSDIHYSHLIDENYLKKVVSTINSIDSDIILLTGDYFIYKNNRILDDFSRHMENLENKEQVFAVPGNHDVDIGEQRLKTLFEKMEIKLLVNEHVRFYRGTSFVNIVGIDCYTYEMADLNKAMQGLTGDFTILLAHNPAFVKTISTRKDISLMLSGHTHGGQIRFPLIGQILPASGSSLEHQMGLYNVNDIKLFITRGVGVVTFPMRFLCNPEINVITLVRK